MAMTKLEENTKWAKDGLPEEKLKKLIEDAHGRNIIGAAFNEMVSDSEDDSESLINLYEAATEGERGIINAVLIVLTGWAFPSLVGMAEPEEE